MSTYTDDELMRDYFLRFGTHADQPQGGAETFRIGSKTYAALTNAFGVLALYDDNGYVEPSCWPAEIE